MKNLKVFLATVCLLMTVAVQPAFAANTAYTFAFDSINDIQTNPWSGTKDDNDQYWYMSIDTYNPYYSCYNTLSSANIFGAKIHRLNGTDNVGRYTTFSNYVSGYPIAYQSQVSANETMYLKGQKDDASTSSETLYVSGRFCP